MTDVLLVLLVLTSYGIDGHPTELLLACKMCMFVCERCNQDCALVVRELAELYNRADITYIIAVSYVLLWLWPGVASM